MKKINPYYIIGALIVAAAIYFFWKRKDDTETPAAAQPATAMSDLEAGSTAMVAPINTGGAGVATGGTIMPAPAPASIAPVNTGGAGVATGSPVKTLSTGGSGLSKAASGSLGNALMFVPLSGAMVAKKGVLAVSAIKPTTIKLS